jgi:predicted component of type VI protein secretion system
MRDQRAEVSLHISPGERYESEPLEPTEFRILVIGDFGGRGDGASPSSDPPRRVDRDDIDAHVARIAPRLRVSIDGGDVHLAFASLDDFHPDRLAARLSALATPSTVDRSSSPDDAPETRAAPPPQADLTRTVSSGSLLDDMLDDAGVPDTRESGSSTPAASQPLRRSDELSAFIDRAVAPHLVRPDQAADARDETRWRAMSDRLRSILHHPSVQALEATWRALELLVRRLDTDGELHVFLFDRPRQHVATAIEQLARDRNAADPERWALVVALHAFDEGNAGAEALAHVAMAAKALDVPCVAAAPASFTGADSLQQLADDEHVAKAPPDIYGLIRQSADARFLGLTYPRVLLRAPYGRDNPCDTIDFDEIDDPDRHGDYLWGSGAALVALLVGEAFLEKGWALGGRMPLDVGGLPYFTYRRGPETVAKSCAEAIMSERVARLLLARGLMPVAWIKDTDRVRVVELRSVGDPSAPLAAQWAGSAPRSAT